jgi:hypothetical protein
MNMPQDYFRLIPLGRRQFVEQFLQISKVIPFQFFPRNLFNLGFKVF